MNSNRSNTEGQEEVRKGSLFDKWSRSSGTFSDTPPVPFGSTAMAMEDRKKNKATS